MAVAAPIAAHHSIASVYDRDKRTTLSAVVKQWRFVNPHPSIVVEVTTPGAPARIWTLEMDNRWELAELGFTENTLKPGDRIEVTGNPSRRDANALYVRSCGGLPTSSATTTTRPTPAGQTKCST